MVMRKPGVGDLVYPTTLWCNRTAAGETWSCRCNAGFLLVDIESAPDTVGVGCPACLASGRLQACDLVGQDSQNLRDSECVATGD